ncbi:hypothetical protein DPMN_091323 [Dreissena polymorpha]|uniref:Uncharacterized protein n=1 Tax=Dreissena polymorpha TaxID=45954 RepID=A0A9D4QZV4_DREPO|nr:hypothetical protein DPMN_091323 [Dreissena polymorpha]
MNLASRVHRWKNDPLPGANVFLPTGTIFELVQDIIWTIFRPSSRVLTRFYYSKVWKNTPTPGGHVFQPTRTIHCRPHPRYYWDEDRTINVASRVLTRENAAPLGGHVFQATETICKLLHDDWKINLASRVQTLKKCPAPSGTIFEQDIIMLTRKNVPPLGGHSF